mgnify:CR=1 FL=1
MATYRRETRIRAPFDEVWGFHSTTDGLEALTPEFMRLEVESVTGPDGAPDPDELDAGSRIELSVRPFGIGPRQRMVSVITERTGWPGALAARAGRSRPDVSRPPSDDEATPGVTTTVTAERIEIRRERTDTAPTR